MGDPCLNIIQLLWCNLNMDVLAAIALCTEPFVKLSDRELNKQNKTTIDELDIKTKRISRSEKLIVPAMWRNIIP